MERFIEHYLLLWLAYTERSSKAKLTSFKSGSTLKTSRVFDGFTTDTVS